MPSSACEWPWSSPAISSAKLKSSPVYMRMAGSSRRRIAISLSLSRSEIFTPSILAAWRLRMSIATSMAAIGSACPQYPASAGSNMSPSQWMITGSRAWVSSRS
jgi:hypothetical protein